MSRAADPRNALPRHVRRRLFVEHSQALGRLGFLCEVNLAGQLAMYAANWEGRAAGQRLLAAHHLEDGKPTLAALEAMAAFTSLRHAARFRRRARAEAKKSGAAVVRVIRTATDDDVREP